MPRRRYNLPDGEHVSWWRGTTAEGERTTMAALRRGADANFRGEDRRAKAVLTVDVNGTTRTVHLWQKGGYEASTAYRVARRIGAMELLAEAASNLRGTRSDVGIVDADDILRVELTIRED